MESYRIAQYIKLSTRALSCALSSKSARRERVLQNGKVEDCVFESKNKLIAGWRGPGMVVHELMFFLVFSYNGQST